LTDDDEFCARLRALQAEGHEVFLHGFLHASRSGQAAFKGDGRARGARRYFAQRVVSTNEAEFNDLSRPGASERLSAGERVLRDAGLRVDGFVPPAWSMPAWLVPCSGRVATGGRSRPSLVLNYASRTPARLLASGRDGFVRQGRALLD
jgi:hypothetical protein